MLILHAAQEVVAEEGFEELLEGVRERIDDIESLHRTRELTVCPIFIWPRCLFKVNTVPQFKDVDQGDQIKLTVDKGGGNIFGGRIV